MAEDPDLERRLDAMFSSARPRPEFKDELWRRIEARSPWHQRLGRRFQPALRFAPALATLLVVALGVTWVAGNLRGGGSTTTSSAGSAAFGGQKALAPGFGTLPALASSAERSASAPQAPSGSADLGQAFAFSGTLPTPPPELPVYRYDEPSAAARAMAASTLEAQAGLPVTVTPSATRAGIEPQFTLSSGLSSNAPLAPAELAHAFLVGRGLLPHFASQLVVPSERKVVYGRLFDAPGGPVRQVRPDGTPAGLTVDLGDGTVTARGPIDLPLASAPYPLRSPSDALGAANVRQAIGAAALDRAEVVYVLVVSAGHGYYEPELLLTGSGGAVLAPLIAPGWLGS